MNYTNFIVFKAKHNMRKNPSKIFPHAAEFHASHMYRYFALHTTPRHRSRRHEAAAASRILQAAVSHIYATKSQPSVIFESDSVSHIFNDWRRLSFYNVIMY